MAVRPRVSVAGFVTGFAGWPRCEALGEVLYDGENPYVDAMKQNITHLVRVLKSGDWGLLRRQPPFFVGVRDTAQNIERLVRAHLAEIPAKHIHALGYVSA